MTDPRGMPLSEALSALKDGEISEFELRRLLKEIDSQPELRKEWANHHALSAVLRRDNPVRYADISRQVSDAIANEKPEAAKGAWKKLLQQFAAAASVAAVTLVAVQLIPDQGSAIQVADSADKGESNIYQDEPMVQFPTGLNLPSLATRSVSTSPSQVTLGSITEQSRPADMEQYPVTLNSFDEAVLRRHFDRVLFEHNSNAASAVSQSAVPLARVPGLELEQE